MSGVIVCYSTCWACKFDSHYDEPTAHTWMDPEDAEWEGIPFDPAALAETRPCACRCGGDAGGCRVIAQDAEPRTKP